MLRNPGFWQGLAEVAPNVLLSNLALVCWAGTAGFLLRFLSRRSIWLIGGAFFSAFLGVGIFGVPHVFDHILVVQRGRDFPNNASVFTNALLRADISLRGRVRSGSFACVVGNMPELPRG
jgi:hypothetical protein